jgi:hypothetical protein
VPSCGAGIQRSSASRRRSTQSRPRGRGRRRGRRRGRPFLPITPGGSVIRRPSGGRAGIRRGVRGYSRSRIGPPHRPTGPDAARSGPELRIAPLPRVPDGNQRGAARAVPAPAPLLPRIRFRRLSGSRAIIAAL